MMQVDGEYSISGFLESLYPITMSFRKPSFMHNFWTFWKENEDCPQTISSSSSYAQCATLYQQWDIKDYILSAMLNTVNPFDLFVPSYLVQFWAPTANTIEGISCILLKTSNHPFCLSSLDKKFCQYRKHCMSLEFKVEENDGFGGCVIGRVFKNKQTESTPNVAYYRTQDYPHLNFAINCGIRSSLALPVFHNWKCVGVLELVSCNSGINLYTAAKYILQLSPLKAPLPFESQIDQGMEDKAPEATRKVLEEACKTYLLPFAQIWISCQPLNSTMDSYLWCTDTSCTFENNDIDGQWLPILKRAACNYPLRVGHGVVGKALLSHKPCFCRDVTLLPIAHYPLSHYARACRVTGCFAFCFHAKNHHHHYVLEFFLPSWISSCEDPRIFLESLLRMAKKHLEGGFEICLGEESYVEVLNISVYDNDEQDSTFKICNGIGIKPTFEFSLQETREEELQNNVRGEAVVVDDDDDDGRNVFRAEHNACLDTRVDMLEEDIENEVPDELLFQLSDTDTNVEITTLLTPPMTETLQNEKQVNEVYSEQIGMASTSSGRIFCREKTSEREYRTDSLSREDLEKHFGKKLDDVAEILGVSRSTLKRACRVNGISKWPSPSKKKGKRPLSGLKHANEHVRDERVEPSSSNPPPIASVVGQPIPNVLPGQDEEIVTVKAAYGDEMIRFQLSCSSKKADLMEKVTLRLPLPRGSFNIKYQDDDGDWILIACDEDLEECIRISKVGKSTIKMLVRPILN